MLYCYQYFCRCRKQKCELKEFADLAPSCDQLMTRANRIAPLRQLYRHKPIFIDDLKYNYNKHIIAVLVTVRTVLNKVLEIIY